MNVELLSQQPQQQLGPGLSDYVSVVKRRVWHVVLPFLGFAGAALALAFLLPKEYQSVTQVIVEDPDSMVGSVFTPVGFSVPHKNLLTTIDQDVHRAEFLTPLVEQYGITEGYNPSVSRERNRMYEKIRRRLSVKCAVQPKGGPDLVEFIYEGRDSVRVTEFVNAVRRKWQDDFHRRYRDAVKVVEQNVEKAYGDARDRYAEAQTKLQNFQELNGSEYFGKDPGGNASRNLADLRGKLETAEFELQGNEAALRTVMMQLEKVHPVTEVDSSKKRSPEWVAQSQKVDAIASQITTTFAGYTDEWPKLREAKAILEAEKKKLEQMPQWQTDAVSQAPNQLWITLTTSKTALETTIAGLRTKIDNTRKALDKLEKDSKQIPEKVAQAVALQDAVFTAQAAFEKATKTRETARATRERVITKAKSFFRVVMETTPEEARFQEHVYPNYILFAGLGAFIGLLVGGGFAFITEFSAASFTTPNQVRYTLQVPVLGEVSPLQTEDEKRSRKRRRTQFAVFAALLLVLVVVIHVMWFDTNWRSNLPPFLNDVMKRLYGGAR
jgi:uncharacterized protein involved in exopolysaccharide biosynthesis